jgi:acyl carrier protein
MKKHQAMIPEESLPGVVRRGSFARATSMASPSSRMARSASPLVAGLSPGRLQPPSTRICAPAGGGTRSPFSNSCFQIVAAEAKGALAFAVHFSIGFAKTRFLRGMRVTATFDKVADIIAETSEIDRETIKPESHTIDDLGIDSLDFLDIVFAIDKEFGIKIPLEQWTQEVNEGKVSTEEYFVLKNLCAKIDELRAAKA